MGLSAHSPLHSAFPSWPWDQPTTGIAGLALRPQEPCNSQLRVPLCSPQRTQLHCPAAVMGSRQTHVQVTVCSESCMRTEVCSLNVTCIIGSRVTKCLTPHGPDQQQKLFTQGEKTCQDFSY